MIRRNRFLAAGVALGLVALGGPVAADDASLAKLEKQLKAREQALEKKEEDLERRLRKLGRPGVSSGPPAGASAMAGSEVLPNAEAGECFAKVRVPARYKKEVQDVIIREAAQKIEVVPARFQWAEEKVLVKQPAQKLVEVPAVFETKKEQIVTQPAQPVWRSGRGPNSAVAPSALVAAAQSAGLPKAVKAGQCFSEFHQPAGFETRDEKVVTKEASKRIEVSPAKYEVVEEKIVVKEAAEKLVEVPAAYSTVTEKVLKAPAYTTWKKGRGPIERLDHATGEILCRVEVPATYETVTRRVLKTPATVNKIKVPAEYKTVKVRKLVQPAQQKEVSVPAETILVKRRVKVSDEAIAWRPEGSKGDGRATGSMLCGSEIAAKTRTITKQVLKTPASVKKVEIPAEYAKLRVRKLASPATEKRAALPAQTKKIEKVVQIAPESLAWQPVLCETNTTADVVRNLQAALKKRGFDPGPIDGVMGGGTRRALDAFQKKEGLATGGVTTSALAALGIESKR